MGEFQNWNLFILHPILMKFFFKCSSLWVLIFLAYLFGKGILKGPKFGNLVYLKGMLNLYCSSNFDLLFFLWIYCLKVFVSTECMSTDFLYLTVNKIYLTERCQKMPISKIWTFLSFIQFWCNFFLQNVHLLNCWWAIK